MHLSRNNYDPVISFLRSHSAEKTPHVFGTLLNHLVGTSQLLRDWGNPDELCLAGLCHAVYGTQGWQFTLLNLSQRSDLVEIIGEEAEEIVYFYASCDRSYLYPQIGFSTKIRFRDRFSGAVFVPDSMRLKSFLELTFANELESSRMPGFVESTRALLEPLFRPWENLVSDAAFAHFVKHYGQPDQATMDQFA